MSVPPTPKPEAQTQKRQRTYLIGAGILVAAVLASLALMDRSGADRDENRGRSNENNSQEPARAPESR